MISSLFLKPRVRRAGLLFSFFLFIITVLFLGFRRLEETPWEPTHASQLSADPHNAAPAVIPLPDIYSEGPDSSSFCGERFGTTYLRNLSHSATNYCESTSQSRLTCFHAEIDAKGRVDSFCVGGPTAVDTADRHFELACQLNDQAQPPLSSFPAYWYETGPSYIFKNYVNIGRGGNIPHYLPPPQPRYAILVKREASNYNLWHSLMEIFSLYLTIDVLQITRDPVRNAPFFKPEDVQNAQVVLLDDLHDGPVFDLWSLFAAKPPARANSSAGNPRLDATDIIVPLPGGSNPLWQGDWEEFSCQNSELLRVFAKRILDFYEIQDAVDDRRTLNLAFINRTGKRRLVNQEKYLKRIKSELPDVYIQVAEFEDIPFKEQLEMIRGTNMLVGVHGAGLTHGMFLRPGSAMVEIMPPDLNHKGFHNLAKQMGHQYFTKHAAEHNESTEGEQGWQYGDVYIEEDRFVDLIRAAARSMSHRGYREQDVK